MRLTSLALVALVCVAGSVRAEDIDNPEFTSWSKFKKGTSITMKSTTSTDKFGSSVNLKTTTLVEVGADKLQVETIFVTSVNGKDSKATLPKREINKTTRLPSGVKKDDVKGGKPPGTYEEGTETVKVGDAEIKTTWYKSTKVDPLGTKTETKTWMSDEVPGGIVRLESTITPTKPN